MILASRTPNGKVRYFDANTGMERKPGRETGRHLGKIPDWAYGYLSQFAPVNHHEPRKGSSSIGYETKKAEVKSMETSKSLWSRFVNWLKSLINGR